MTNLSNCLNQVCIQYHLSHQVANQTEKSDIDSKNSTCLLNALKLQNINVIFGQIMSWRSGGNMSANQSLYEVLITLIGIIYKKEALNKLSLLEINTYTKTWENMIIFSSRLSSQYLTFDSLVWIKKAQNLDYLGLLPFPWYIYE